MVLSQAARERALRRGPGLRGFLLAHHGVDQLSRCYQVWLGDSPVWFCSRCVGLYPAMLVSLGLQIAFRWPAACWEAIWMGGVSLPALWDWAAYRLDGDPGTNLRRTWSGALLGLALGRSAGLHGMSPFHLLAWGHIGILFFVVLGVEVVARLQAARRGCAP